MGGIPREKQEDRISDDPVFKEWGEADLASARWAFRLRLVTAWSTLRPRTLGATSLWARALLATWLGVGLGTGGLRAALWACLRTLTLWPLTLWPAIVGASLWSVTPLWPHLGAKATTWTLLACAREAPTWAAPAEHHRSSHERRAMHGKRAKAWTARTPAAFAVLHRAWVAASLAVFSCGFAGVLHSTLRHFGDAAGCVFETCRAEVLHSFVNVAHLLFHLLLRLFPRRMARTATGRAVVFLGCVVTAAAVFFKGAFATWGRRGVAAWFRACAFWRLAWGGGAVGAADLFSGGRAGLGVAAWGGSGRAIRVLRDHCTGQEGCCGQGHDEVCFHAAGQTPGSVASCAARAGI